MVRLAAMNDTTQHEFTNEKFLTIACNVLNRAFLESARTDAKNIFKTMQEGKRVALIKLQMEDESELRVDASLNSSEFNGRINFGAFRANLQALLGTASAQLENERNIVTFTEQNTGATLFGVPGITQEEGELNALLMAADFSQPGTVHLQLQYMEPGQFLEKNAEPA